MTPFTPPTADQLLAIRVNAGIEELATTERFAARAQRQASRLSAIIAEKAIEYLEGPVVRVAGFDTPFPYTLEPLYMPDNKRVLAGIEKSFVW